MTAPAQRPGSLPVWVNRVFGGLVVYALLGLAVDAHWVRRPQRHALRRAAVGHPRRLVSVLIVAATSRHAPRGPLRTAWVLLAAALALYVIATRSARCRGCAAATRFPGPADIFYSRLLPDRARSRRSFFIRAAAVQVPWVQLSLDATIFVVGFGAFFWFLVIRAAASDTEVDLLKQALSQAYVALDCVLLLVLGVLLLARRRQMSTAGRRVPLLLLGGFAAMFLGDILWSLAKVRGYYLPGQLQDVLYLCCYVPMAAAGREQHALAPPARRARSRAPRICWRARCRTRRC